MTEDQWQDCTDPTPMLDFLLVGTYSKWDMSMLNGPLARARRWFRSFSI